MATDAARKYAELTDTQLSDRKQNSLNKRDAHKSIKDAIVNKDHHTLFHLAVRMGGFDARDLGAEYEQFGTGRKSVVHLIQSLAKQAPQQQSMQEQIRGGVRLRSADAKAPPQQPQSLQEQIREGVKLKPADERKLAEAPKVVAPGVSEEMQARLATVLAARRSATKGDESDSDWEFGRIRMRRRKTHLH